MTTPPVTAVKSGRRLSDWHIITSNGKSIFFFLFGMFLDERHKPSMSRCMVRVASAAMRSAASFQKPSFSPRT